MSTLNKHEKNGAHSQLLCFTIYTLLLWNIVSDILQLHSSIYPSPRKRRTSAPAAPFKKLTMSGCNARFCEIRYNRYKTINIEFQAAEKLGDFNVKVSALLSKPARRFLIFDLEMDCTPFNENECRISKHGTNYTISHPVIIKEPWLKDQHTLEWTFWSDGKRIICSLIEVWVW
ncbi:unnamed protein product [Dicrocoelium dendriticum]|nr:unnamed protein product [Dicrocoelium dendriticum]